MESKIDNFESTMNDFVNEILTKLDENTKKIGELGQTVVSQNKFQLYLCNFRFHMLI